MHDPKAEAKRQIQNRIDFYETVRLAKTESKYFEADIETKFIDPFLKALGWDPSSNEVKKRFKIGRKVVDYALQIGGVGREPNILVEVKSLVQDLDGKELDEDIQDYITYPEKVVGYAWRSRVNWAILTNFKELRVYNVGWSKIPEKALWFSTTYDKFLDDKTFERIWAISREGVATGILDTYDTRTKRKPVDRQFLEDLVKCRRLLIDNIHRRNKGLTPELLKECTQRILDRLVIMRAAEDLRVEKADLLRREIVKEKGGWDKLKQWLFRNFDKRFNSRIFAKHPCDDLEIDDEVVQTVVDILYNGTGESSGYRFDEIHADMLGSMYEDYIGYILKEEGEIYKLEKEMDKRKAKGIYYTPTHVVEYIVENTLGTLLKGMSPPEVKNVHILDPACGSGSFLTKAQDVLKRYYESTMEQLKKKEGEKIDLYISKDYASLSKDILTENIYGVDLDSQAAEIASVNLSLKILADMKKEIKLPEVMGENIKVGNSLISNHRQDLKKYFRHPSRKKPFNWDEEFPQVFEQGGFDVVIGNPPWIESKRMDLSEKAYYKDVFLSMKKQYDIFNGFMERGIQLLKDEGILGFIMPNRFLMNPDYELFREFLLKKCEILEICDVGEKIFAGVEMPALIIILRKQPDIKKRKSNQVRVRVNVKDLRHGAWEEYFIPQKRFLEESKFLFTIYQREEANEVIKKMERISQRFGDLVFNARGVEIGKRSSLVSDEKKDERYVPFLVGENIDRYAILRYKYLKLGERSVDYKPPDLYKGDKILIRKTGTGIRATFDDSGFYVIQVIYLFKPKVQDINLKFFLGLLNSKLLSFFYFSKFGEKEKKVFPHLRQECVLQLPIRKIDFHNPSEKTKHNQIVEFVNKMLLLNKQLNKINTDFERYSTEPIVSHTNFRDYYDKLSINEKEALNKTSKGNIRKLKVEERGDWLVFKVDYITRNKGERQEFKDVEVVKCKFKDESLRKFLFYTINNYKKPLGTGNLLLKILRVPIPCFDKDPKKNELIIAKMMKEYLKAVREKERLEKEIQEIDNMIDQKIYELYGLTDEEIKIVEESLLIQA